VCATLFAWVERAGRCVDVSFAEGRTARGDAGSDATVATVFAG